MSIENLIDSHRYSLDRSAFFNEFNEFMNGLGIDERSSQAPNATRPPSASFTYGPNQAMVLAAILPEQGQLTYEIARKLLILLAAAYSRPNQTPHQSTKCERLSSS